MDKKSLIEKIFSEGNKQGLGDMEVYYSSGRSLSLKVFKKELDGYSLSESEGISLRGVYNGKMGYSYSEKVDESSIKLLVRNVIENATVIDSDDEEYIYEGSKEYREVKTFEEELEKVEESDKIKFVKQLEAEALSLDKRVESVDSCVYGDGYGESIISNTKGLYLHDKSNLAYTYVQMVAKDGNDI
ncbi:MAG TPA: TldD/PmbA family protein, partial [Clostridiales bacterium]|nr:TldD/PmbA family protein [Clostridiales bacterium]